MRAVTWQGRRDVRVDTVPDPTIERPGDAIVKITSTNVCGSDLHLYETLGAFMTPGGIVGHEPMGIVEEVGSEVTDLRPGDRVVMPFQISCATCWMCDRQLYTQCETTQVRDVARPGPGCQSLLLGSIRRPNRSCYQQSMPNCSCCKYAHLGA